MSRPDNQGRQQNTSVNKQGRQSDKTKTPDKKQKNYQTSKKQYIRGDNDGAEATKMTKKGEKTQDYDTQITNMLTNST